MPAPLAVFSINDYYQQNLTGNIKSRDKIHSWIVGGGFGYTSTSRFTYATSNSIITNNTHPVGIASPSVSYNSTNAWFVGGFNPSSPTSFVSRLSFANDDTNSILRGNLTVAKGNSGNGTNFSSDGWICTGNLAGTNQSSTSDRIAFTNDTAVTISKGLFTVEVSGTLSTWNISNVYTGGGTVTGGASNVSNTARLSYSTDATNAVAKANLTSFRTANSSGGIQNRNSGYYVGSQFSGGAYSSNIESFNFASDTVSPLIRANINAAKVNFIPTGDNNTFGLVIGGVTAGVVANSTVEKYIFATDTINALIITNYMMSVQTSGNV